MSVDNSEFELLRIVSQAIKEMSEGELLQIDKSRKLDITEEVYFDVIQKKTASLIAACCASGAASVTSDKETIAKMKKFGELIGLAFQIKDDIFDYGDSEKIGKPTGNDIREQKMTLPLIYVLNHGSIETRRELINIVKNHNVEKIYVKKAIKIVVESGGIEYAQKRMIEIQQEAIALLNEFEDNDAKHALLSLVDYTVTREK
jgi:octaprenyl-diphosphate synthase